MYFLKLAKFHNVRWSALRHETLLRISRPLPAIQMQLTTGNNSDLLHICREHFQWVLANVLDNDTTFWWPHPAGFRRRIWPLNNFKMNLWWPCNPDAHQSTCLNEIIDWMDDKRPWLQQLVRKHLRCLCVCRTSSSKGSEIFTTPIQWKFNKTKFRCCFSIKHLSSLTRKKLTFLSFTKAFG